MQPKYYPKRIDIYRDRWSIVWSEDMLFDDEGNEAWGLCYKDKREIHVSLLQPPKDQLDTLLHEIMHALWHFYGCEETETEENAVLRLASGLSYVTLYNRNLTQFTNQVRKTL